MKTLIGGRYKIVRELAEGGQGTVFLAEDSWAAPLQVVLKVAHKDSPSFLQSEFQTLRTLRHPALVGALDWVVEDDFTVLVEEYIEGEQAAPWARWQSQRDLLMAFSKIAHGLMHLHARGFVHLDVNPNNLLVDSAKVQLRLVDLGLARPLGQAGASGTPGFIAPEVLHGEPADARADVWSLAATMIFLLEGESSDALSLRSWLGSIQPEPLRALLDSALSELPSKRPDMRAFWRGILSEAGVRDVAHAPMALTPMVGRSKEKQLFKEFLQESTTTLLLHGTGGSGRSELLRAWGDLARVSGYRVIELNASSSGCHQFLWDALSQHEGEAKVPLHISHQSPVDAARALVLRAEKSALETPLLLSFDDADPELLSSAIMKEALRLWFSRGQKSRTKIIAVSHCGDFGAQCMKLGALSSEDHAQWIDLAWGGEPPPGMRRALFDLSGGLAGPTWRALLRLSEGKDLRRAGEETLLEEGLLAGQLWHLLRHFDRDLSTAQLSVISKEYNQNTSDFLEDWLFRGQLVRSSVAGNIFYFIPTRLKLSITQLPPDEAHRFSEALLKAGLVSEAALFVARSGDMQRAFDLVDGQSHELQIFAVLSELIALEEWPAKLQDDYFKLAASEGQSDFFERVLKAMAGESGPVVQNLRRSWASASILQGQYQKALGLLPESHAIEDAMQRARALYFLGQIAEARQEAVTYLDAAQGAERGRLLEVRGNCEMAEGESQSAFDSLSEAVALFEDAQETLLFSRASHSLAIVCQRLGDYKNAQEHYETSLRDAPPLAAVSRRLNLGTMLQDTGDYKQALQLYTDARQDAAALGNERELARAELNLANLKRLLGDYSESRRLAHSCLERAQTHGAPTAEALSALVLAEISLEQNQLDDAQKWLLSSEVAAAGLEMRVIEVETNILSARLLLEEGLYEEAAHQLSSSELTRGASHLEPTRIYWLARACFRDESIDKKELNIEIQTITEKDELKLDLDLYWRFLAMSHRFMTDLSAEPEDEIRQQALGAYQRLLDDLGPELALLYSRRTPVTKVREELNQFMLPQTISTPGTALRVDAAFKRLLEINRKLARADNSDILFELIIDSAVELLGAERGFILLREGESVEVKVARSMERQGLETTTQQVSRSMANTVLQSGETLLTTNAQDDVRFSEARSVAELKLRSVLCVPLRVPVKAEDTVVGALYLDHRYQARAFNESDLQVAESFADQAAIALQNARLLEQTRQQEAALAEQNERLKELNAELRKDVATYSEQAEAALRRLREEGAELGVGQGFERFVGRSKRLREVLTLVDRFSDTDVPVYIYGESGVGKELVARALHERSWRKKGPFVSVNCAAIPENLIESELFGYRRGAFTGAVRDKKGLFSVARGGTLLLDEVGDMPLAMQVKLLRVLQERSFRAVGATQDEKSDVRIISASHKKLSELVSLGEFREDLFFRLHVVDIEVPPLRERREDVIPLIEHFSMRQSGKEARKLFSEDALRHMLSWDWPGNVRELENEVVRALTLADGQVEVTDLSPRLAGASKRSETLLAQAQQGSLREILGDYEREVVLAALRRNAWNVRKTADDLGLSRAAFYTRMNKLGISRGG